MKKKNRDSNKPKTKKSNKNEDKSGFLSDMELKNLEKMFLILFVSSTVFLGIYLIGFINILWK